VTFDAFSSFLVPLNVFGTDEATYFKFGRQIVLSTHNKHDDDDDADDLLQAPIFTLLTLLGIIGGNWYQNLITSSCSRKFHQNPFITFRVSLILLTDKPMPLKHNLMTPMHW